MERDKFLRDLKVLLESSIEEREKMNLLYCSAIARNDPKQIHIVNNMHLYYVQRCAVIDCFINASIDKNEKQIEQILTDDLIYYQENYVLEARNYEMLFNAKNEFKCEEEYLNFKEQNEHIFNRRFEEAKSSYETINKIKQLLDNGKIYE